MAGVGACVLLLLVGTLAAHHSPAVFDQSAEVVLTGTVSEFRWMNPHSWIDLDVAGDAELAGRWSVEMTAPTYLVRAGWRRSTLSPGDEVVVVVNPLRTGEQIGKFVRVTLADGTELSERARP
jgi:hypothetical protein